MQIKAGIYLIISVLISATGVQAQVNCSVDTSYSYYVRTGGSDSNSGTSYGSAFRTIQKAADVVTAGSRVCIAAGTYYERVLLRTSGTSDTNRITFQGEDGAVIDGSDAYSGTWTQAAEIGPNVWKATNIVSGLGGAQKGYFLASDPYNITAGGKYVLRIPNSASTGSPLGQVAISALNNGPTLNRDGCCYGVQTTGWNGIDALGAVSDSGTFYLRFADNRLPANANMRFAPADAAAFAIDTRNYITLRGLVITGARRGISISSGSDNIIENNSFSSYLMGIRGLGSGARNIIRNNSFTRNYIYNGCEPAYGSSAQIQDSCGMSPNNRNHWRIWSAFKWHGGLASGAAAELLLSGSGNEFSGNTVTNENTALFGIGPNGRVFNNTISYMAATGLVFGSGGSDQFYQSNAGSAWHDNVIAHANAGIRLMTGRPVDSTGTGCSLADDEGPINIYRNRIYGIYNGVSDAASPSNYAVQDGTCFQLYGGNGSTVHVYHNSCSTRTGIANGGMCDAIGYPRHRFVNNVFSSMTGISSSNQWGINSTGTDPSKFIVRNWIGSRTGGAVFGGWGFGLDASNLQHSGQFIWTPNVNPGNWALPTGSSCPSAIGCDARNYGYDLSATNSTLGAPYPGMTTGYAQPAGELPDLGVVEVGDAVLPSSPSPPSGLRIVP